MTQLDQRSSSWPTSVHNVIILTILPVSQISVKFVDNSIRYLRKVFKNLTLTVESCKLPVDGTCVVKIKL